MAHVSPHTTVVATYRVRPGRVDEFLGLIARHHPTLVRLGLATAERPQVFVGAEDDGRPIVFEIFTWTSPEAPGVAHHTDAVMDIWNAMSGLVEERDGRPMFEFPHVTPTPIPDPDPDPDSESDAAD